MSLTNSTSKVCWCYLLNSFIRPNVWYMRKVSSQRQKISLRQALKQQRCKRWCFKDQYTRDLLLYVNFKSCHNDGSSFPLAPVQYFCKKYFQSLAEQDILIFNLVFFFFDGVFTPFFLLITKKNVISSATKIMTNHRFLLFPNSDSN